MRIVVRMICFFGDTPESTPEIITNNYSNSSITNKLASERNVDCLVAICPAYVVHPAFPCCQPLLDMRLGT